MNEYIAYCGLNCEACEARLATVNNDDALRQRVAREWSELNGVEITAEMINQDALLRIALSDPSVCSGKKLGDLWKLRRTGTL